MNLNIFKNHKQEKNITNKLEKADVLESKIKDVPYKEKIVVEEDFSMKLENLNKLIKIKRELGGNLNIEEVEQASDMSFDELMKFLGGGVEFKAEGKDLIDTLQFAINATEGQSEKSLIQKVASNSKTRALIFALVLLGKFAPQAHGAENSLSVKDKTINNKETTFNQNTEPDLDTYYAGADEFKNGDHKKSLDAKPLDIKMENDIKMTTLEMANYFDTDSHDISPEVKGEISEKFEQFLSQINSENADKFIKSNFTVFGSSDERKTNNPEYEGKNENLTKARIGEATKILEKTLHDYEFKNLPKNIVDKIKIKTFIPDMPTSQTGPEKGVTYVTDLKNPNGTGNFNAEDVSKIKLENPDLYKKLLDDCRKITFKTGLEKIELTIFNGYDNVIIVADNTPSVTQTGDGFLPSNKYIAKILSGINLQPNQKCMFGKFDSSGLNSFDNASDLHHISALITNLDGKGNGEREASFKAAIEALEKFKPLPGQKTVLKILTDEKLQDANYHNYAALKASALEKGVEVWFAYGDDKKQTLNEISLEQVGDLIKDNILKTNGHPSVKQILEAKDGSTVEDHFFEIFGTSLEKDMTKKAENSIKIAKSHIDYDQTNLKIYKDNVDKYQKIVDNDKKGTNKYNQALNALYQTNKNKDFMEKEHIKLLAEAEKLNKNSEDVKNLLASYTQNHDKSILFNPLFAGFSGWLDNHNVLVEQDKFENKINLGEKKS